VSLSPRSGRNERSEWRTVRRTVDWRGGAAPSMPEPARAISPAATPCTRTGFQVPWLGPRLSAHCVDWCKQPRRALWLPPRSGVAPVPWFARPWAPLTTASSSVAPVPRRRTPDRYEPRLGPIRDRSEQRALPSGQGGLSSSLGTGQRRRLVDGCPARTAPDHDLPGPSRPVTRNNLSMPINGLHHAYERVG
jgi:hypothetical protein